MDIFSPEWDTRSFASLSRNSTPRSSLRSYSDNSNSTVTGTGPTNSNNSGSGGVVLPRDDCSSSVTDNTRRYNEINRWMRDSSAPPLPPRRINRKYRNDSLSNGYMSDNMEVESDADDRRCVSAMSTPDFASAPPVPPPRSHSSRQFSWLAPAALPRSRSSVCSMDNIYETLRFDAVTPPPLRATSQSFTSRAHSSSQGSFSSHGRAVSRDQQQQQQQQSFASSSTCSAAAAVATAAAAARHNQSQQLNETQSTIQFYLDTKSDSGILDRSLPTDAASSQCSSSGGSFERNSNRTQSLNNYNSSLNAQSASVYRRCKRPLFMSLRNRSADSVSFDCKSMKIDEEPDAAMNDSSPKPITSSLSRHRARPSRPQVTYKMADIKSADFVDDDNDDASIGSAVASPFSRTMNAYLSFRDHRRRPIVTTSTWEEERDFLRTSPTSPLVPPEKRAQQPGGGSLRLEKSPQDTRTSLGKQRRHYNREVRRGYLLGISTGRSALFPRVQSLFTR